MKPITENDIELSAIEILQSLGWDYVNGKTSYAMKIPDSYHFSIMDLFWAEGGLDH